MSAVASVARARCSALLTEATLVSSSSAASLACHFRTSHRMSAARCFGGRCCSAATKASRSVSRCSASSSGVGSGVIQVTSGSSARFSNSGSCAGPEIHRPRAALAARERVEADVRRDPVQPRLERRAALEPLERPPGAQHRLLHGVLGVEGRAEHAVAVAGELAPVLLEGLGRGGLDGGHDRHPRQGASSRQSAAARSSSSISIFVIFSIAAMAR